MPMSGISHRRPIQRHRSMRALVIALFPVVSSATLCMAQTAPVPANPQIPATQSLQAGIDPSSSTVAPTTAISTPSVTAIQGVASISSSSRPGSLRSAGQGLPGMPGGPPIRGPLGYQDPASAYMRPPSIGPLQCDPFLDGVCD